MAEKKTRSLSNQLVRLVILPLLLLVILVSGLQVQLYFQSTNQLREQYLNQQVDQLIPLLSKALYDADEDSINLLGDTLYQNPRVTHLMISDQFARVYLRTRISPVDHNTLSPPPLIISRPLSHTNSDGQRLLMGNITIHFTDNNFSVFLTPENLSIITLNLLKLLLPLVALFIFLQRKVNRPIRSLIDGLKETRPDHFKPQMVKDHSPSEIHELVMACNTLQENNHLHHIRQKEVNDKLMERNQEVAEGRESARLLSNMLQSSQKRYRALFHRSVDPLLIVEPYRLGEEEIYRIIDANYSAIDLLKQPLDTLTKQNFEDIFGLRPLEHGSYPLPENILAQPGETRHRHIELHFNMVLYDKHSLYYVTLKDVTDKIRAENLEKEASELMNFRQNQMAIAEMATTIAHEINQPLAAIQNYANAVIKLSKPSSTANQANWQEQQKKVCFSLEQLNKQAQIASDIVKHARGELGRNDYPQDALELTQTVHNTIDLCQFRAEKLQVKINFYPLIDQAWVIANEVQIKQILINLINNALDVLEDMAHPSGQIILELYSQDSHYILEVKDNGTGISDIQRVFTNHYTTKKHGLGMGLAICRSLAEIHHGTLSVNNRTEGGAVFSLKLPAHEPEKPLLTTTTSVN